MRDSIIRFTKDRTGGSNDIITAPKCRRHVHRTQVAVTTAVFVMKINKTQKKSLFSFLTTTMSSASQIDRATMSEDRLVEMLSKMKSSREAEALRRARLPAQLAPSASNMSIVEPIQTVCTNPTVGVYCYSCEVDERRICMSVAVIPPPHSQSQDPTEEPHAKPLEFVWRDCYRGEVYRRICGIQYAFYLPSIRSSSSWNALRGDSLDGRGTTRLGHRCLDPLTVVSNLLWKK